VPGGTSTDVGFVIIRCRFRVSPMPRLRPYPGNPMQPPVASSTVEKEPAEFALQFGFRTKQLHPQTLRCRHEARLVSRIDLVGFLNESIGVSGSIGDGSDSPIKDLALLVMTHGHRLAGASDRPFDLGALLDLP
jgi:hypothetical protein